MNHADSLPVGISVRKLKFTVGVKYQVWEDKHQVSIVQFCSSFQSAFNPGSRMTQICYRFDLNCGNWFNGLKIVYSMHLMLETQAHRSQEKQAGWLEGLRLN